MSVEPPTVPPAPSPHAADADGAPPVLDETADALALLTRVARAAAARTDPSTLSGTTLDALVSALRADGATLYAVEGDHLVELAGIAVPGSAPSQSRLPLVGTHEAQLLATHGAREWLLDEAPEKVRRAIGEAPGARVASAAIPSRGLSVGLIHVVRAGEHAQPFSPGELALLATVAAQIGPGLELALRQPTGQPADEQTDQSRIGRELSVLHRIAAAAGHRLEIDAVATSCVELARELTGADWVTLYLVDEISQRVRLVAGNALLAPLDLSTLPMSALTPIGHEPRPSLLHVDQLEEPYREMCRGAGIRLTVAVPLQARGEVLGFLGLGFRTERRFERGSLDTLMAMAEQEAVAIECARHHQRSELHARLAGLVREAASSALGASTDEQTWDALLEATRRICGSDAAHLALFDGDARPRIERASGQPLPQLPRLPADDALIERMSAEDEPLHFEADSELMDRSAWGAPLREAGMPSLMVLPLRQGGALTGLIALHASRSRRFYPEEIEAKGLMASVAATAVEARRARRAAEEQRARLGQIMEQLPTPSAVLDSEGRFEEANAAYRALIPTATIGRRWIDALASVEIRSTKGGTLGAGELNVPKALRGETAPPTDIQLRDGHGSWRHIHTHTAPLRRATGDLAGAVIAVQDVTSLRELADAKDRFLDIASHELRNPLANLRACAAMLEMDPAARTNVERRQLLLTRITHQVDRLTALVEELVEMGRLRGGTFRLAPTRLDLAELTRELAELAQMGAPGAPGAPTSGSAAPPRHRLHVVAPAPVEGSWDRQRIAQVVTNLVSNAARYSPDGSEIVIRVVADGNTAHLSVEDQGIGIAAAELARVFEPYYRAPVAGQVAKGGLGLGLYIAHEIVRHHRGRIEVESTPGVGSRFTVVLPREP